MQGAENGYLTGTLVRLILPRLEEDSQLLSDWTNDSEFSRLLMAEPARFLYPEEQKKWLEQALQKGVLYMIQNQEAEKPIGVIHLSDMDKLSGNAWISVGIGERDYWGKNYGSEAIFLMVAYAFGCLGLHRISLTVFSYNTRAVRAYQKAGFKTEGSEKQAIYRDGQRWDIIYMGILKREWENNTLEVK